MSAPTHAEALAPAHEAHGDAHEHHLTENNFLGVPNIKLAMWAFLGSECMFFGSLIGTYFYYHENSIATGQVLIDGVMRATGPNGLVVMPQDVFDITITSISTFLLLMSSLTMALGVDSIRMQKATVARNYILMTALLGAAFVGFQIYEFTHFYNLGLALKSSLFGSTFYVMTGFHGAHVSVGVIWLTMCAVMLHKKKMNPAKAPVNVEVAGLYWHFVDIVWIVIFTFVYLLEFAK